MNFLAHVHLSGSSEEVMVGNFIGDFVKGRDMERYSEKVRHGILLHRLIDEFTDNHPVVAESKKRLRPKYRHYAGVIVDVFYDHLLASEWSQYSDEDLRQVAENTYQVVTAHLESLPERVSYVLPYMIRGNWLYNYRKIEGIRRTLEGMSRRTRFNSRMEESYLDLIEHKSDYADEFSRFYPDLQDHARKYLTQAGLPI